MYMFVIHAFAVCTADTCLCVCVHLSLSLSHSLVHALSLCIMTSEGSGGICMVCVRISLSLSNSVSLARFMYDILMIGRDLY